MAHPVAERPRTGTAATPTSSAHAGSHTARTSQRPPFMAARPGSAATRTSANPGPDIPENHPLPSGAESPYSRAVTGGCLPLAHDSPIGREQDRDRSYPAKRHDGHLADTGLVMSQPHRLSRFSHVD